MNGDKTTGCAPEKDGTAELRIARLWTGGRGCPVLRGVTLTLKGGCPTALLGGRADGCAALLAVLAGRVRPLGGRITLNGAPLQRQDAALIGADALKGGRSPRRALEKALGSPDEARTAALMEKWGLLPCADRPLRRLSPGERTRTGLALAEARQKGLWLIDGLPVETAFPREALLRQTAEAASRMGAACLWAGLTAEEALRFCGEGVVLDGGRVVQTGVITEVYRRPACRAAALALGRANFLTGVVTGMRSEGEKRAAVEGTGVTVTACCVGGAEVGDRMTLCVRAGATRVSLRPVPRGQNLSGTVTAVDSRTKRVWAGLMDGTVWEGVFHPSFPGGDVPDGTAASASDAKTPDEAAADREHTSAGGDVPDGTAASASDAQAPGEEAERNALPAPGNRVFFSWRDESGYLFFDGPERAASEENSEEKG